MSKRKRDGLVMNKDVYNINYSTLKLQQERLYDTLESGKKSLFHALKLARGFERQKLGRRQKIATENKADVERLSQLNAEISALKVGIHFTVVRLAAKCPATGS